jgi:hypothetical protein
LVEVVVEDLQIQRRQGEEVEAEEAAAEGVVVVVEEGEHPLSAALQGEQEEDYLTGLS